MFEEIDESELKSRHNSLLARSRKSRNYLYITLLLAIPLFLTIVLNSRIHEFLNIESSYGNIFPISIVIVMMIFGALFVKKMVPVQDRLFFQFYGLVREIDEFTHNSSNKTKNNVLDRINKIFTYTDGWTASFAPPIISDLPKSITSNFEDLWDFVESIELDEYKIKNKPENDKKIIDLKSFCQDLREFSFLIYHHQPTHEELSNFNQKLQKIHLDKEKDTPFYSKVKIILSSNPKFRFGFSPVAGLLYFTVFHLTDPTKLYESSQGAVFVSLMILPVLYMWIKKTS